MSSGEHGGQGYQQNDAQRPAKRKRLVSPFNEEESVPSASLLSLVNGTLSATNSYNELPLDDRIDPIPQTQSERNEAFDSSSSGASHEMQPHSRPETRSSVLLDAIEQARLAQPEPIIETDRRPNCVMNILRPNDLEHTGIFPRWGLLDPQAPASFAYEGALLDANIPIYYFPVARKVIGINLDEKSPLGMTLLVWTYKDEPGEYYHTQFYVLSDRNFERTADFIIGGDWLREAGFELSRRDRREPAANSTVVHAQTQGSPIEVTG